AAARRSLGVCIPACVRIVVCGPDWQTIIHRFGCDRAPGEFERSGTRASGLRAEVARGQCRDGALIDRVGALQACEFVGAQGPQAITLAIVARVRIGLMVAERIPADVRAVRTAEGDEDDERGPPPTAMLVVIVTARGPAPEVIVIDPTPVVIRGPAPRLVANPSPTVRRTPDPVAVAIGHPIIIVDDGVAWSPDEAVVVRIDPVAVSVEFFRAPDILIVVAITIIEVQTFG